MKHDTAPAGGFAHMGSTREGPDFHLAKRAQRTFGVAAREDEGAFSHAGTTREGPDWGRAGRHGPTVSRGPVAREGEKGFANAGSSREGPHHSRAADAKGDGWDGDGESRLPRIRRAKTSREHSGGSPDGFRHNFSHTARVEGMPLGTKQSEPRGGFDLNEHTATAERQHSASHYGTQMLRDQRAKGVGGYEGGREGNWTPTGEIRGERHQQGPRTGPGREDRHAFSMSTPQEHLKGKKWLQAARERMERKGTVGSFTRSARRAGQGVQEHARSVLSHKGSHSPLEVKRANFARNAAGAARG
ncbi:MAG TPA: hypothetical protein VEU74_12060 [Gemmatimonadales bacterium]|nr:hypothetical protein [Gemmatimonadales bacterium]